MKSAKIVDLQELVEIVVRLKKENKKIVLSHGVFDLIHIGHIRHFGAAKKLGDVLIATVTPDQYVNKGPGRPIFTEELRVQSIAALDAVDYVAINKWPTAVETVRLLKPDTYTKDVEYKFKSSEGFAEEVKIIEEIGGEMKFTTEITHSSSNLITKQIYREEVVRYLERLKDKYNAEDLYTYLNDIRKLKVLVIGEIIIDEYCSGKHMGKTRRESIVEFMADRKQRFLGGSGIIANHLSNFTDNVDILSLLGDRDSQEDFVNNRLDDKIKKYIFTKKNSPTPIKTRYIEEKVGYRNLFKVAVMNDEIIDKKTSDTIIKTLDNILPQYDLVIVVDYGHGMIDDNIMNKLTSSSKYLAVNTQINAENKGYNTIDKYSKIDYGCTNEEELRLLNRDKYGKVHELISKSLTTIQIDKLAITMGYHGCVTYSKAEGFNDIPALSINAIDAMGAGDAFFALTSPLAKLGAPMDMIGFVGNASGAIHIGVVGNKKSVGKDELFQYIESLMK